MRLADGVATCGECHGFLIVHRHAGKGFADHAGRLHRIGLAVHAFGVHIDQAHMDGRQRVFQRGGIGQIGITVFRGRQPFGFRTPIDVLFGGPDVFAAKGKAIGLEPHAFIGDGPGKDHQVGPRDAVAVFLLDRPEQAAGLVEVGVIRPAVQGRKAVVARARATAAIGHAIGARRMPGHADHQATVMAPIGGPPILTVGHQGVDVALDRVEVELLDLIPVVEPLQRVRLRVMLVQDVEVEGLGPPCRDRGARGRQTPMHNRAFAGVVSVHVALLVAAIRAGRTPQGEGRPARMESF